MPWKTAFEKWIWKVNLKSEFEKWIWKMTKTLGDFLAATIFPTYWVFCALCDTFMEFFMALYNIIRFSKINRGKLAFTLGPFYDVTGPKKGQKRWKWHNMAQRWIRACHGWFLKTLLYCLLPWKILKRYRKVHKSYVFRPRYIKRVKSHGLLFWSKHLM